jgi:signal transduction histidine kinase/HAMP domain-containing protein
MVSATLFENLPYVNLPTGLLGWVGWFTLVALIVWVVRKHYALDINDGYWWTFGLLGFASLISAVIFIWYLPGLRTLPLPSIPQEISYPMIQVLAAIPWVLSAGMLGAWPTVLFAFLAGTLTALWGTHNAFTPLEFSLTALLLVLLLRQNYRAKLFGWLRTTLGAAVGVAILCTPVFLLTTFFSTNGNLAARLDFAFTQSWVTMLTTAVQVLIAGFVCEVFQAAKSKNWIKFKTFIPSPFETGLQDRVLYISMPLVLALLFTLAVTDWVVAGKAAREMMQSRLESTAKVAVENIPAVIDTGQGLVLDIVSSGIPLDRRDVAQEFLKAKLRTVPFFSQLFLFDLTGVPITGYPVTDAATVVLSAEETSAIQLALNGVQIQNYLIAPAAGETSAYVVYIAAIPDEYGLPKGVIIARSNLAISLFSQPAIQSLQEVAAEGGSGAILDAQNRILYSTNPELVFTDYKSKVPQASSFFTETGADGTQVVSYAAITDEQDWKVILSLPVGYAQQLALETAIPLLAISLLISLAAYFMVRFMIGGLTTSLSALAVKADEISKGALDNQIEVHGVDELGRLGSAFEQMRVNMKKRLQELDTLLDVSQGIASNFGLEQISIHILNACLAHDADSARMVLLGENFSGVNQKYLTYAVGRSGDVYKDMDKTLLEVLQEEPILVIPSKPRIKRMFSDKNAVTPSSLAGWSLLDGERQVGMLWVGYDQPHRFQDDEVRFLNTIAGQAVVAVANAGLYMKAEVGKRRLESILAATPEAVLVVDDEDSVLVANLAAQKADGILIADDDLKKPAWHINSPTLLEFINSLSENAESTKELLLENGKTYEASVSEVETGDTNIGKVCVLRDVTAYRELEKLKADFITTVSHDLRAPMGILRGYSTMIQMVGELNPQQKEYAGRIADGLEGLDQMVEKLLDIGRIESGEKLQTESVAPIDLVDHVVRLLQPQAAQRKVQVMRELTLSQDVAIEADKTLLQQALYNLVDNAIKFSPVNGQVFLRLQSLEDKVIFEIQDQGPGIAPLDIPRLFERGSLVSRNQDGYVKGGGLGLTIVKSIAEKHGGSVYVKSVLGRGSTFFLELPLRQDKKE